MITIHCHKNEYTANMDIINKTLAVLSPSWWLNDIGEHSGGRALSQSLIWSGEAVGFNANHLAILMNVIRGMTWAYRSDVIIIINGEVIRL